MTLFSIVMIGLLFISACLFTIGLYMALKQPLRYMRKLLQTERRHRLSMKQLKRKRQVMIQAGRIAVLYRRIHRQLELLLKATQKERYNEYSVQRFLLLAVSSSLSAGMVSYVMAVDIRFSLFVAIVAFAVLIIYQ
ncbi:hypothetical protein SAMN03159341_108230 [Paenibacillus sp. 1_12]|uniref:hypothetical protein n=1 Tax=Paenibacillus sp. 1_12 TaxID=1566278 RepID=UPI0008EADB4D|nr:hypothetical protein [Paenibacillus sp. 1_12]SFL68927.1 hypothetical protein SAMN03159341_108230 [Paenibacillus sp. 1_12]